jgi:hypothetical protein
MINEHGDVAEKDERLAIADYLSDPVDRRRESWQRRIQRIPGRGPSFF